MAVLSWGKPRLVIGKLDDNDAVTEFIELPTPVENSTQLTTAKGDKKEAKVEGGENEDVKYGKNTYALATSIRAAKNRQRPLSDVDGVIAGNYVVFLQPEDPDAQGFVIDKSVASVEDSFTTEDGGIWAYGFDALKAKTEGQVKWGKVSFIESGSGSSKKITQVSFTKVGSSTAVKYPTTALS